MGAAKKRDTKASAGNGGTPRQAPLFAPTTVEQVFGMLSSKGAVKSIEEMDAGVRAEARRRAHD